MRTRRGIARPARARAGARGFTLIEILAVVAIFALMASFVVPRLSSLSGRTLRREAERLASHLDLARQRSVVTGTPHRVLIDLEDGAYRIEWLITESEARGESSSLEPVSYDLRGEAPLPLEAPRQDERRFRPLPGLFGRAVVLAEDLAFARLETAEGWIERGESSVPFERDGTTLYTAIVLDDASGNEVTIEVLPLADAARIRDEPI
jgi:type II secretion system protein H